MPVIPAIQEAIVKRIMVHGVLGKSTRPYLKKKKKLKQKGLGAWPKWQSTYLASVRP
jgi:hypothetical protein